MLPNYDKSRSSSLLAQELGGIGSWALELPPVSECIIWEFPKIGGTLFWGPYNKDLTIKDTILGSPIFGNSHMGGGP